MTFGGRPAFLFLALTLWHRLTKKSLEVGVQTLFSGNFVSLAAWPRGGCGYRWPKKRPMRTANHLLFIGRPEKRYFHRILKYDVGFRVENNNPGCGPYAACVSNKMFALSPPVLQNYYPDKVGSTDNTVL
jgi:hypothetical protein